MSRLLIGFVVTLPFLILLNSCGITKGASADVTKERTDKYLLKKINSQLIDADWMSAKIKAHHKSEALNISFSGNLRLKKDSALWVNIKKFGFEVARALIRPDSIFVIDRFNGDYIAEDIQYIQRMLNFPADFGMLQSMVLGNPVFFTQNFETSVEDKQHKMVSTNGSPNTTFFLDGLFQIREMSYEDKVENRVVEMSLDQYREIDRNNFSYLRNIFVNSRETGQMEVEISFSDVELNVPKKMPFNYQ